jgi:processive rubber oxygenase RoxA-like protein
MKLLIALSCAICISLNGAPPQHTCDAINLDQGWTPAQSEMFWFTSQGSRMMPYSWFLSLEVADPTSQTLFTNPSNMSRYGFIAVPASPMNKDGLPIGFTKDVGNANDSYVGLNCAACHTGSLNIGGKSVIVEGGPALGDFWTFLGESVAALETALTVPAKFERFSKKVLNTETPSADAIETLRGSMKAKLTDLQLRISQNTPPTPYGNGRVDAFAHILTHVLAQDFNVPSNAAPPYAPAIKAPVSYPFLWDTPQHDLVQWNGSAPNSRILQLGPLSRNTGEVLGVFGELEVTPGAKGFFGSKPPQFKHSVQLANLIALENTVKTLWSPVWPKNCLPLADSATLARGEGVYRANCVSCHAILKDPERKDENRQIKAELRTLPEVQTDPTMAMNFVAWKAKSGPLEGAFNLIQLQKFGPEAPGYDLLLATVNGIVLHGINAPNGVPIKIAGLEINLATEIANFKSALQSARTPRYKARPLNGIWATAPYLHNGSVPTLWDLLNTTADRPQVFYIGSRDFDSEKVGISTKEGPGTFRFDTSIQGNWRNGHEFGTSLPVQQKKDLLEYLKTL